MVQLILLQFVMEECMDCTLIINNNCNMATQLVEVLPEDWRLHIDTKDKLPRLPTFTALDQ